MNETMTTVMTLASALAVFVLAPVQLIKVSVNVSKNLIPLIGLVMGLIIGAVAYPFTDLSLALRLWAGGLAGLSATGLFEQAFSQRKGTTK